MSSEARINKKNKNTKFIDLRGRKFGGLTPLIRQGTTSYSKVVWLCQCDCGNTTKANSGHLLSGARVSCGCRKVDRSKYVFDIKHIAVNEVSSQYKKGARYRDYSFELSEKDISTLMFSNCYYCSSPPSNLFKRSRKVRTQTHEDFCYYNGIDRVDNTKGYNLSNCVSCCYNCNKAKSALSLEDFKQLVCNIYNTLIVPKKEISK